MSAIFTPERSDYQHVLTVYTAPGKLTHGSMTYPKARLWVLEDRQVIACVPEQPRGVLRIQMGLVSELRKTAPRQHTLTMEDGSTSVLHEASCACGMGRAGSAGPVDGKWKMDRVRRPEWYILEAS